MDTAVYHNFIFLIILIFSTYKIGVMIKNRYVGILAAFYMLMCPGTFGYLRIYFTSLANTAFVSLGIYALLSSNYFRNTKKVILWTLSCIMLLKLKFEKPAAFLLVPTLIYLWQSFAHNRKDPAHIKVYYRNALISLTLFLALFFLLFGFNVVALRVNYYLDGVSGVSHAMMAGQNKIDIGSLLIYFKELFNIQLSTPGFFFFAVSLPFFLRSKSEYKAIIISWFLFPYVFHSLYYYISGIRAAYYTASCLPAIALITSCGMYKILLSLSRRLRLVSLAIFVSLFLMNYMYMSHFNKQIYLAWGTAYTPFMGKIAFTRVSPDKDILEETQRLINIIVEAKGSAKIVLVNHYPSLHTAYSRIRLNNAIKRNKVSLYDFSIKLFNIEPADSEVYVRRKLAQADLVINGNRFYPAENNPALKRYKQFSTWYDFRSYVQREERAFNAVKNRLAELKTVKTKSYKATIYVNKETKDILERKISRPLSFDTAKSELDLLKGLQDLRHIEEGPLRLFFSQGQASISWEGRELTGKKGLGVSFSAGGIAYSGADFSWEIEKTSPNEITAIGYSPALALRQVWKFTVKESRLVWQVLLEPQKSINLRDFNVNFCLKPGYNRWIGKHTRGDIPFFNSRQNINLGRIYSSIGIKKAPLKTGQALPALLLDFDKKGIIWRISMRRMGYLSGGQVFLSACGSRNLSLIPERYDLFTGTLSFVDTEDKLFDRLLGVQDSKEINKDKLGLYFDRGRVRIFSGTRELTAREGVFIRILYGGKWYFSAKNARWTVKKEIPPKLIVEGIWEDLPVESVWEFQIGQGGIINYRLEMKTSKEINPEHILFVVMLPDRYNRYFISSGGQERRFPLFRWKREGWERIWSSPDGKYIRRIGVTDSRTRESIVLDCIPAPNTRNFHSVISNTDKQTCSRAFIYDRMGKGNEPLPVGSQTSFEGTIEVNTKEDSHK